MLIYIYRPYTIISALKFILICRLDMNIYNGRGYINENIIKICQEIEYKLMYEDKNDLLIEKVSRLSDLERCTYVFNLQHETG